jgi:putative transposase
MIEQTVEELTPIVGTRPACRALGVSSATVYRRRRPPEPKPKRPRSAPARSLSEQERQTVLGLLHSERFVDSSPAQVWATLLDEGRYLASERTMYRLLAANGEVRERRDQLTHPAYARPELLAEQPNELWSWDISKLKGPATWSCFHLYVILDVFSRYCVGWTVQQRESAEIAKALIAQAAAQQQVEAGQLTVHADRGTSMRSKPVAFLLADLGVLKTHSRPYTSTDNPYQRSPVQDLEVSARVPRPVRLDRPRPRSLPWLFPLVQPRSSPLRDRPDDPGRRPPRPSDRDPRRTPARAHGRLRGNTGAVRPPAANPARATDRGLDQQADHR